MSSMPLLTKSEELDDSPPPPYLASVHHERKIKGLLRDLVFAIVGTVTAILFFFILVAIICMALEGKNEDVKKRSCGCRHEQNKTLRAICFLRLRVEKLERQVNQMITTDGSVDQIQSKPILNGLNPGTFIYDYEAKLTGIVDDKNGQRFVRPLDVAKNAPPRNIGDLVRKAAKGHYVISAKTIKEEFRAVTKPLLPEELKSLGSWVIARKCDGFKTYRLLPMKTEGRRVKRCAKKSLGEFGFYDSEHWRSMKIFAC